MSVAIDEAEEYGSPAPIHHLGIRELPEQIGSRADSYDRIPVDGDGSIMVDRADNARGDDRCIFHQCTHGPPTIAVIRDMLCEIA